MALEMNLVGMQRILYPIKKDILISHTIISSVIQVGFFLFV